MLAANLPLLPHAGLHSQRAMNLHLGGNQLTGTLPPWLEKLPLFSLDLSRNKLTGSIPSMCDMLAALQLSENQFSGTVALVGGWRMTSLDLSNNNLSGTIPETLGDMHNLVLMHLSFNPGITGTIPGSIAELHTLQDLDLRGTSIRHTGADGASLPWFIHFNK